MKTNATVIILSLVIAVAALLSAGCVTVDGLTAGFSEEGRATNDVRSFPSISNNAHIELESKTYESPLINSNNVTIKGRGMVGTVLAGDVRITGNGVTLTELTIDGDAILEGNNITLTKVRVTGITTSSGNNNTW